jgi:Flp pilus assembly protein TadD
MVPWMTAAVVVALLCLAGCQSSQGPSKRPTAKRQNLAAEANPPDSFDAGAGKPPTAATMYSLARILAAQGNTNRCIGVLRNLIQSYPDCAPAYNALAEAYLSIDRADEAISALTAGVTRHPKDPILLNNLGMAYFLDGDYQSALANFDRASDVQPDEPTYRSNKAAALGMLGRVSESAELYRKDLRQSEVHENIDVLLRARRASAQQQQQAKQPTTAPSRVQ